MSCNSGPNNSTNGIVFAYDMGNTKKSWKGRPLTNQFAIPTPDSNNNVTFQVNGTGIFKRVTSGTYGGYNIQPSDIVYRYDLGALGCHYHGNDVTINSGQTATWSCDYYVDPSTTGYPQTNYLANFEGVVSGAATDPSPSTVGVWKRFVFSSTASSTGTCRMLLYPGACGNSTLATSGFILYKNPQVEFDSPGNSASPFVAGTRSNTQAIVDLTGNNTITASSLTYASDGTFSFNGSNSLLNCGTSISPSNITISSWVYMTSSTSNQGICRKQSAYAISLYNGTVQVAPGNNWTFYNTGISLSLNTWTNIVWKYDGSTMTVYINGISLWSTTLSGSLPSNSNPTNIGYDENGWYWNGYIPVTTIYNRALTASEISQNFNALRGRYGI